MLEIPFNENPEDFRLRINNHLENNLVNKTNIQETVTSSHIIAQSYLIEGNISQAKAYFHRAVELYRETSDEFGLAFCLSQYTLILRHLSKYQEPETLLN